MKRLIALTLFLFGLTHVLSSQFYWKNYANDFIIEDLIQIGDDMWIGSQGGLMKYNLSTGQKEIFQPWNSPLKGDEVTGMAKGLDGSLWIGVRYGGLFNYNNGLWTRYSNFLNDDFTSVTNIIPRENGDVWFLVEKGGCTICHRLFRLKDRSIKEFTGYEINNDRTFHDYTFEGEDKIFLAQYGKVSIYSISQEKVITDFESISFVPEDNNYKLSTDKNGNVILAGVLGMYKYEDEKWLRINEFNAMSIFTKHKDNQGNLYFQSYLGGEISFVKYDGTQTTIIYANDLPLHPYTPFGPRLMSIDDNGHLWFSIYSSPLEPSIWKLKDNEWQPINTQIIPLSTNYLSKSISDCDNNIWFTGSYGVDIYKNNHTWQHIPLEYDNVFSSEDIEVDPTTCGVWVTNVGNQKSNQTPGLVYIEDGQVTEYLHNHSNVYNVEVDQMGDVFISSWGHGLGVYKNESWTWYNENNSPIKSIIYEMDLDEKGNLYIATQNQGLLKFDGFNFYTLGYGLAGASKCYYTYVDNDGLVWLQTNNGLALFNGLDWINYSDIFPEETINSIKQDQKGNYWISTWNDGLYYWDKQTLINFDNENSGLRSRGLRNVDIDANGTLWVIESRGATTLFSEEFEEFYKIKGRTYYDKNQSQSFEENVDLSLPGQKVYLEGSGQWVYSNGYGDFTLYTNEAGQHVAKTTPITPWVLTTDEMVNVSAPQQSDISFGLFAENLPKKIDLSTTISSPICNTSFKSWVILTNKGLEPVDGILKIVYSQNISIKNLPNSMKDVGNNTIEVTIQDLKFLEQKSFDIVFSSPTENEINEEVFLKSSFEFSNRIISDESRDSVLCSYDPNDKKAEPTGDYFENFYLKNDAIKYTIRFENEGNYKASQIIIIDTIEQNLNLESFEFVASSHPCETSISDNGIVKFNFEDINLPPKKDGRSDSQGFVSFKITPKENLAEKTLIRNKASIFFDFNPPIITNETATFLVENLNIVGTNESSNSINIYPNPSNGDVNINLDFSGRFKVFTSIGKLVSQGKLQVGNNNLHINSSNGLYLVEIKNELTNELSRVSIIIE